MERDRTARVSVPCWGAAEAAGLGRTSDSPPRGENMPGPPAERGWNATGQLACLYRVGVPQRQRAWAGPATLLLVVKTCQVHLQNGDGTRQDSTRVCTVLGCRRGSGLGQDQRLSSSW